MKLCKWLDIWFYFIGLATKWLRILSIPPNDKIRNHLVANPIKDFLKISSLSIYIYIYTLYYSISPHETHLLLQALFSAIRHIFPLWNLPFAREHWFTKTTIFHSGFSRKLIYTVAIKKSIGTHLYFPIRRFLVRFYTVLWNDRKFNILGLIGTWML